MDVREQQIVIRIDALKTSFAASLKRTEEHLQRFITVDNGDEEDLRKATTALLNSARVAQLIGLADVNLLLQEVVYTLRSDSVDSIRVSSVVLDRVVESIFLAHRCLDAIQQNHEYLAPILCETINELRYLRGNHALAEGELVKSQFQMVINNPFAKLNKPAQPRLYDGIRKLSQAFERSMLKLDSDESQRDSLQLMSRVLHSLHTLCGSEPISELWLLGAALVDAAIAKRLCLRPSRKRLLNQLATQLKAFANGPGESLQNAISSSLRSEMIALLALASPYDERTRKLFKVYRINVLAYTDQDIEDAWLALHSPDSMCFTVCRKILHQQLDRLIATVGIARSLEADELHQIDESFDADFLYIKRVIALLQLPISLSESPLSELEYATCLVELQQAKLSIDYACQDNIGRSERDHWLHTSGDVLAQTSQLTQANRAVLVNMLYSIDNSMALLEDNPQSTVELASCLTRVGHSARLIGLEELAEVALEGAKCAALAHAGAVARLAFLLVGVRQFINNYNICGYEDHRALLMAMEGLAAAA